MISWLSYLYNGNPYTWKDCLDTKWEPTFITSAITVNENCYKIYNSELYKKPATRFTTLKENLARSLCLLYILWYMLNSLAPGRCRGDFQSVIFEYMSWIKFVCTYEFPLRWMPQNTFAGKSILVQVMAYCHQGIVSLLRKWAHFWQSD